jgi:hypothetical protein
MSRNIGDLWCAFMHDAVTWPIHGEYRCRSCGRRYAVPWSESRATARAPEQFRLSIPTLLTSLLIAAAFLSPRIRAEEPAIVRTTDGAAGAFARYTSLDKDTRPWPTETIDIQVSLPMLARNGRLRAIRKLLPSGRPQYHVLEFAGDQIVKREVIARYLSEDVHAAEIPAASVAITPANYKLRYNGSIQSDSGTLYVFSITPRRKREGLIKGQLWLDGATGIAVRQCGYLVKRPSIFVKRIDVAREIRLRDGVAEMRITRLSIDTRVAGRAELTIEERPFITADTNDSPDGLER